MFGEKQKERARIDPASVFRSPDEIVAAKDLTRGEKLEFLRRWRYDAIELNVAADEGMGGTGSDLLDGILAAIDQLDPGSDDAAKPDRRS